jgi:hypothetical protein
MVSKMDQKVIHSSNYTDAKVRELRDLVEVLTGNMNDSLGRLDEDYENKWTVQKKLEERTVVLEKQFMNETFKLRRQTRLQFRALSLIPSAHQVSKIVKGAEDEAWILGRVPNKVAALILIYRGSRDGWDVR